MSQVDIFRYKHAVDYLEAVYQDRKSRNPRYSLRSWCKQLGLNEAGSLSLILNRKRNISKKIAAKLKASLCQSEEDSEYFNVIMAVANSEDEATRNFYLRIANDFKVAKQPALSRLENFEVFKGWYHFVILEMTKLADFSENVDWLYRKFGESVPKHDLRSAMIRLTQLGYLVRLPNGKLERREPRLETSSDIPNTALRRLHKEFIARALAAVDGQELSRRDITAIHTTTSLEKIPEAKKMIAKFRNELLEFLDVPHGDTVYQVNIQMFDLLSQP